MIVDSSPSPPPVTTAAPPEQSLSPKVLNTGDLISDSTHWPSLSESLSEPTRPSPKSSPAPFTDTPISAPSMSNSHLNHQHPNTNFMPNPNTVYSPQPNRQRPSGRGGSNRGGVSRGGFIRHPSPPQQLPSPPPLPFYGGFEGPIRGPIFIANGYGAHPHPRPSDHNFQQPRSPHRGGGRHLNRVNYRGPDWNAVRFPQPGPPMIYQMPPQQMVPFPFMHVIPPESFMGMPPNPGGHGPVPPPSLSPPPSVELETKLLNQINYYFSNENLIKDMYLRSQMDDGGWVSVTLIANFKKVRELTEDIHLILESLRASAVVEVQGDKIRRRNDWRRWIATTTSSEPATGLNTIGVVAL